jgi:CRP-like cAMP-binding protein
MIRYKTPTAARRLLLEGQWFKDLSPTLQTRMLDNATVRSYESGRIISAEDAEPIGLFAVLHGHVDLVRHVGEDRNILLHVAGPGFWFGELALLRDEPTVVTAIARGDTDILLLPIVRFRHIAETDPGLLKACARLALQRYAILIRYLAQAQWLSAEDYLGVRLADLVDLQLQDRSRPTTVELDVSQADLARMVGTSRQTVNALLQQLEKRGLIEVCFRRIRVLDPDGLRGSRRKSGL